MLIATAVVVSGCASIISGNDQTVNVVTDVPARCELKNDKGTYAVDQTPANVTVQRSEQPLTIDCVDRQGRHAHSIVGAQDNEVASFAGGGLIGMSVDKSTGARFSYPSVISVSFR